MYSQRLGWRRCALQVGAQPFKAAENLGEIDMRDTESVRIDRAEM